jgi:hypothetical protein
MKDKIQGHTDRRPRTAVLDGPTRNWRADIFNHLTEASKAATLDLAQCATAAQECDRASNRCSGQSLEQVPGGVVEKEDALEGNQ